MPILVVCQKCNAKLNAPDSGAGKHVRCPKPGCAALIPVPDLVVAEAVDEEAPKPVKATVINDDEEDRPRKRRRDDDEDDDRPRRRRRDDDEDRPRKKFRKSGMGTGMIVAIVLGSIVVLGGIGYGIYALVSGGGPKTPPPPGWKEYTYKDAGFKAYFPSEPKVYSDNNFNQRIPGGGGFGGFGGAAEFGNLRIESSFMCVCGDFNNPVHMTVEVVRFNGKIPSDLRNEFDRSFAEGAKIGKDMGFDMKSVRWLGERGGEVAMGGSVTRVAVGDRWMVTASVHGPKGQRAKPDEEKAFFDNFQLTK